MSKLEELIKEFCPNGVEYVKIGSVVNYEQPSKYLVKKADYKEEYSTPVLTAGQTFILGYTNEMNGIYNALKDSPVIIFDDFTGAFKWVDFPFKVKSSAIKFLKANEKRAMLRYIFHVMGNINLTSTEHKRLWIGIYSELQIPLPALPVQREIVRVLDSFTLYSAELTAELTARRKQYEFYRDKLLTFEHPEIKTYKIKDIAEIYLGLTYTPNYVDKGIKFLSSKNISNDYLDLEDVKYISREEFEKSTPNAKPKRGDVLFTRVGSNLGHPTIVETDEDLCIFVSLGYLRVNEKIVKNKYIKHWMNTEMFWAQVNSRVKNAPKANLNSSWMREFNISIPPIEVQERIVKVLDNFDEICSVLKIGLPAEMEKRQQQYEYYRDKLLTFDTKSAIILRRTDRQG